MKKLFVFLFIGVFTLTSLTAFSQSEETQSSESMASTSTDSVSATSEEVASTEEQPAALEEQSEESMEMESEPSFHQIVKKQFIDGGPGFMGVVLLCLIFGLAVSIERIIFLNLSTTNVKKLIEDIENALNTNGIEAAKEVCRNTRGPIASIFIQGLMRMSEGIEIVEKSIVAYGSVEMGKLEKGMVWISLFISLGPMLGFLGTVIGMVSAFDAIAEAGDVSPTLVAGGIKVALLTTIAGLIVAMILQVLYNYLISKIDSLVNSMEDASITLVDILVKHKLSK